MGQVLDRDFYAQDAPTVARALLGATLVRQIDGARVSGTIVEIEAYSTPDDLASHGYAKRTGRNWVMWDAPGHAYVYLIYGMYWLLNIVCEPPGGGADPGHRAARGAAGDGGQPGRTAAAPLDERAGAAGAGAGRRWRA